jgi:hypothetical protein
MVSHRDALARAALVIAAAASGCQGRGADRGAGSGSSPAPPIDAAITNSGKGGSGSGHEPDTKDNGPVDRGSKDTPTKPDEPEAPDPGKMIDSLGAIPAWQAVIDRADLLARRGQHGVAYGRLGAVVMIAPSGEAGFGAGGGPTGASLDAGVADAGVAALGSGALTAPVDAGLIESPYRWLVDDTDGNGTLAIRVALGAKAATVKVGDRVALGGAWALDVDRHWFWKVDAISPLPPAAPSDLKEPPAAAPTHVIANGELPPGARTISLARDNDAVYFQIVGPTPTDDAEGWEVADQLGNPTFATLSLPGERPSYGGQDMRAPDEHWSLRRGQTYWVRIGKLHKHGADKPMTINARTAPIRVL